MDSEAVEHMHDTKQSVERLENRDNCPHMEEEMRWEQRNNSAESYEITREDSGQEVQHEFGEEQQGFGKGEGTTDLAQQIKSRKGWRGKVT